MHRETLLKDLYGYLDIFPNEKSVVSQFTSFVEKNSDCFERFLKIGHVTGSAFLLSPDGTKILLTKHAKLQKWLQLGGHADGCPCVQDVALREAVEESGIPDIFSFPGVQLPIDIDIHKIPSNQKEESHLHYDVRYLFQSSSVDCIQSNESIELKWVPLEEVALYSNEISVLRVVKKIQEMNSKK